MPCGPGPFPPAEGTPGARSPTHTPRERPERSRATPPRHREKARRRGGLPRGAGGAVGPAPPTRPSQARPGRALGPERGGEPEPVPPRGRYLDGFLQHRHPAFPGLRLLLLAEPGAGRPRPRLSACPGDGAARPGPCSFKLPATVTGAGGGEGRNEAGQPPSPPEAGGGNTRTVCRKYPKPQAERAERRRKTSWESPSCQTGGRASADGAARAGTEIAERGESGAGPTAAGKGSGPLGSAAAPGAPEHRYRSRGSTLPTQAGWGGEGGRNTEARGSVPHGGEGGVCRRRLRPSALAPGVRGDGGTPLRGLRLVPQSAFAPTQGVETCTLYQKTGFWGVLGAVGACWEPPPGIPHGASPRSPSRHNRRLAGAGLWPVVSLFLLPVLGASTAQVLSPSLAGQS